MPTPNIFKRKFTNTTNGHRLAIEVTDFLKIEVQSGTTFYVRFNVNDEWILFDGFQLERFRFKGFIYLNPQITETFIFVIV